MFLRLFNRVLYAPEGPTTEGAIAAMNTALEEAGVPASSSSGGDGGGDGGGEGGEAAGGEGGDPGSQERGGAGGGEPGAGAGEGAGGEQTPEEIAAAAEAAKGGKGAQGDPEADRGDGRNASGRFVKKAGETDEQLEARRSADPDDGKPAKGGKKVDHINDPIPDEIKGRTRERIEGLAATAKDLTTKLTAANAELEHARDLVSMIDSTGADPETFARHMDVLALMHSPDVDDKAKVLKYLRAAADKIGAELGETPAGKDPLEGHQDLLDEVDAGELTRARAEEIAKGRNQTRATEALRTRTTQQQQEQDAAQRKRDEVKAALNGLTAELRKKDGAAIYDRKHKLLVPFIRRLNPAMKTDAMVQAVREAYAALELPPAPQPHTNGNGNRAPAGTGGQQPMRHRQGAGGGQVKQPASALEAMNGALEELAGGGR